MNGSAGWDLYLVSGGEAWLPPTRACAHDTLILAFSHEGRRDPPAAGGAWFRVARLGCKHLDSRFRGNDGGKWEKGSAGGARRLVSGGGIGCRRRGLDARDTLILAFSHEGRRDPMSARGAWFWVAGLVASIWIPAFAGMTG